MNIKALMQARYPEADFGEYFRFLVSCVGTLKGLTHEHHIAPRKQFPELAEEPENMSTLTVADHANAHRILSIAHLDFRKTRSAWIISQASSAFISERIERMSKRLKKQHTDPVFAAAHSFRASSLFKKMNADPVFAAARNAAASNTLKKLNADTEFTAVSSQRCSKTFTHIRWHVNRRIINLKCELCRSIQGGF